MSRQTISIVTTFVLAILVSLSWMVGCGPTEPADYQVYHDEQGGFSFSYPSDWREATEKEWEEFMEGMGTEGEDLIEQGIMTVVFFIDPSESGILTVMTYDFQKSGEPFIELDETISMLLVASFAMAMGDFHLLSTEEATIGKTGEGGREEAWEFAFEGEMESADSKCNAIITSSASKLYIALFVCEEIAYDTLKPAYHNFKETFRFQ